MVLCCQAGAKSTCAWGKQGPTYRNAHDQFSQSINNILFRVRCATAAHIFLINIHIEPRLFDALCFLLLYLWKCNLNCSTYHPLPRLLISALSCLLLLSVRPQKNWQTPLFLYYWLLTLSEIEKLWSLLSMFPTRNACPAKNYCRHGGCYLNLTFLASIIISLVGNSNLEVGEAHNPGLWITFTARWLPINARGALTLPSSSQTPSRSPSSLLCPHCDDLRT